MEGNAEFFVNLLDDIDNNIAKGIDNLQKLYELRNEAQESLDIIREWERISKK